MYSGLQLYNLFLSLILFLICLLPLTGSKAQFGPGTGKEIPCSTTTNSTMVQCMNGTQCNAQCDAQSQACYLDKANCCTNLNCCPPGELAKCPEGYSLCNKEYHTNFTGKCILGPKCPRAEYGNKKCYDGEQNSPSAF